jgi:SAM-dependent methyltransferase
VLEFTGERVVPGLVDPDLFNEHLARYRFAARFITACFREGAAALDMGSGSGYGTAEFADAASVVGIDISADAVKYARAAFGRPGVHFLQAACESLPFADGSFDLCVAFEVIEHLERWREMLTEARRVLRPSGVLLVSTPNKAYYAESRGAAGPNPWHAHEFEYGEFRDALAAVFPHVRLWNQNHAESIAFVAEAASRGTFDAAGDARPERAHFYFAACGMTPIAETGSFALLPSAGNILRERERHIALLETQLAEQKKSHAELYERHRELLDELERSNAWAGGLDTDLKQARARIVDLQEELRKRLAWVRDLEAQIESGQAEIARLNDELFRANRKAAGYEEELRAVGQSKWVRLGRKFNLGPVVSQANGAE